MSKKIEVWAHVYDNPKREDGSNKPNDFLGEFEILDGDNSEYSFTMIGLKDGVIYKIVGHEVSGFVDRVNAGTRCSVHRVKWLDQYLIDMIHQAEDQTLDEASEFKYQSQGFAISGMARNLLKILGLSEEPKV